MSLGIAEGAFQGADRQWRVLRNLGGAVERSLLQLRDWRQRIEQTDSVRLDGIELPAGIEQIVRSRGTDEARKPDHTTGAGEDADLYLREPEDRARGAESNVAGERQLRA